MVKRKLDAGQWVLNYGLLLDYRTQGWDTVVTTNVDNVTTLAQFTSLRGTVVKRDAKFYQPDIFLSLKRRKWRLDLEVASSIGNVGNRTSRDVDIATNPQLTQPLSFLQLGGALQTDVALLPPTRCSSASRQAPPRATRGPTDSARDPGAREPGTRSRPLPECRSTGRPDPATSTATTSTSSIRTTRTAG